MAQMYDSRAYGGGAPAGGVAAGIGYAAKAGQAVKDYISKRKSSGSRSAAPSADTSAGPNPNPDAYRMAIPSSYKRGGMVRKTGLALVHRGEKVSTASQTKKERKRKRGRGARR